MKSLIFEGRKNVACDYDSTENDLLHQRNAAGVQIQTSENNEDFKKNCSRCFEISSPLFICGITKKGFVF